MNFNFTNLKVGSLIEMEIMTPSNKMIKLKTIVEEIVDDSRLKVFAPISKGVNYPLRVNQGFTLITVHKYPTVDKYDILSCRCKIVDKYREGSISTVEIVKTGNFSQIQRRNYFRLPLIKNIKIKANSREFDMLTKDISGSGIRGYVSQKIPIDTVGTLVINTGEKDLELIYKVIECSPDPEHSYRYEMRANFPNMKNSQLSQLLKFIFSKQSESIRKQIDLKEYKSILDSEQHYSDFFTMSNLEKIIRLSPIVLWGMTMVELGYLVNAFREQNMGLNFFFGEFTRDFRPEILKMASTMSIIILGAAIISSILNSNYNTKTKKGVNRQLIFISLISIITLIIYAYFT